MKKNNHRRFNSRNSANKHTSNRNNLIRNHKKKQNSVIAKLVERSKEQESMLIPDEIQEIPYISNSLHLYNYIIQEIKFESDINKVKEIALYYFDQILEECPDAVASMIHQKLLGFAE